MKIALHQMRMGADPAANLARALAGVRRAARRGAEVICLPELFRTPYFCRTVDRRNFALAEPADGPLADAVGAAAREHGIVVVAPFFERRAAGVYHNSAAVFDSDGSPLGLYRKMHIPDDPGFYEKYYFTPGDLGFKVFDTRAGRIGVLICWDQWFPEAARLTAMQGAGVIFYPTAIGWLPREKRRLGARQRDAWLIVQRGHAAANGVYVAAVNRTGLEGGRRAGIEFWGSSFVAGPQGEILAAASVAREELLVADVDLRHMENIRQAWPFWRDRRTDAYAGLTGRFL